MAEILPAVLAWIDTKKHQAMGDIAKALAAPETIGPDLKDAMWDVSRMFGRVDDTGDAKQNARNLMMGFGTSPLSVHKFTGAYRPPGYSVEEVPPENLAKISSIASALYVKSLAAAPRFQSGDFVTWQGKPGRVKGSSNRPWIEFQDGNFFPVEQSHLEPVAPPKLVEQPGLDPAAR